MKLPAWGSKLLWSLAITLCVWVVFSWPLPRHVASGIPSSSQNIEKGNVRRMIAGDHLQAHYFYWLFSDMVAGGTRPMYNPYEFNTGNDEERFAPGPYNLPFSLVYTIGGKLGGQAFGWNLTGLVTLWFSHLFTWLLLGRYVKHDFTAALLAIVGIALPFRWVALLGGSPAGLGMMWVPLLALGLDGAMRSGSLTAGLLAAAAVPGMYAIDSHVFFFGVLSIPAWCALSLLAAERHDVRAWISRAGALAPAALTTAVCVFLGHMARGDVTADASFAQGKQIAEIALWTPFPKDLVAWAGYGKASHIYVGFAIPVLLAAGLIAGIANLILRPADSRRPLLVSACVVLGSAAVVILALGPNGPWDGALFKFARAMIPPYSLVRQSVKIFTVLPVLFALGCALATAMLVKLFAGAGPKAARARVLLPAAAGLLIAAEYACQVRPTICMLDTEQKAYEAVALDAAARGVLPRAIVVPIWPGDSAWASLYEHYVSLYRIRMINGYSPVVPEKYKAEAFGGFGTVNPGVLSNGQIDDLLRRGIGYLILHEDAFPEQVSPFPVWFTLKRFLEHPRMRLLKQDGNVWAFSLLATAEDRPPVHDDWAMFFPARTWELENCAAKGAAAENDPSAGGGYFVRLGDPGAAVYLRPADRPFILHHWRAPGCVLMLRARGEGTLVTTFSYENAGQAPSVCRISTPDWTWIETPLPPYPEGSSSVEVSFSCSDGCADLDLVLMRAGKWSMPSPGESLSLPAPAFFHAGYSNPDGDGRVMLRADRDPDDAIFYGPNLPLPEGNYRVELEIGAWCAPDVLLGTMSLESDGRTAGSADVRSGAPAEMTCVLKANLPVRFKFSYSRNADVEIRRVHFRRIE